MDENNLFLSYNDDDELHFIHRGITSSSAFQFDNVSTSSIEYIDDEEGFFADAERNHALGGLFDDGQSQSLFGSLDRISWRASSIAETISMECPSEGETVVSVLSEWSRGDTSREQHLTLVEKETQTWLTILEMEEFIRPKEMWPEKKQTLEDLLLSTEDVRNLVTTNPQELRHRLVALTKLLKSPNGFHQRSIERIHRINEISGALIAEETERLNATYVWSTKFFNVTVKLLLFAFVLAGYLLCCS